MVVVTDIVDLDPVAWPVAEAVDNSPKAYSKLLLIARWASILTQLIWAARWPLIIVVAPIIALGYVGATAVGAAIGSVAVVSGPWRSPFVRVRFTRSLGEVQTVLWKRIVWPKLCRVEHLIEIGDRRTRIAKCVRVQFGSGRWWRPSTITITVRPLARHYPPHWKVYVHHVLRFTGYRSGTWVVDPDDPKQLILTIRRDRLPKRLLIGKDVPVARFDPVETNPANPYRATEPIYLGVGEDGEDVVWNPDESGPGSLFVAGRTGGGKGFILKLLILFGVRSGWRVWIANPKGSGEFRWFGSHVAQAKTTAGMYRMVHEFRAEMIRRAELLDDVFEVDTWDKVALDQLREHDMHYRHLLIVDEMVDLLQSKGTVMVPPPEGKGRPLDLYYTMVKELNDTAAQARAFGMSLVCATQHGISEHLGPFGSTMKSNFGARIAVGFVEPEAAGAMFGKDRATDVAVDLRDGRPGRCFAQGLTNDDAYGRLAQMAFAETDVLVPLLPTERPVHQHPVFEQRTSTSSTTNDETP